MARERTKFICEQCGAESLQWSGKCAACGEWNTLVEHRAPSGTGSAAVRRTTAPARAVAADSVVGDAADGERLKTGLEDLDRVLGGGLVSGSLVLVAGDPGVGKSTLLLQAANSFASAHGACLYVSGEESLTQVAARGRRLGRFSGDLMILTETDVRVVEEEVERIQPRLLVVDSVQAVYSPEVDSLPGTLTQVRECAVSIMRIAKDLGVPTFLVGHVTKEGAIAGPRVLEHMVDVVLSLTGDRHSGYRVLRGAKNRFGPTEEMGLLQMTQTGLAGVQDASAALLAHRRAGIPGSSVAAVLEGTRPLLVEIQALVTPAPPHGMPRRSVTGMDYNRACMVIGVLEKRAGLSLSTADIYINVPGGIRVGEPAADLGLALALASSFHDAPVDPETACLGELGLGGEVRPAPELARRLAELRGHGFRRCLVPLQSGATSGEDAVSDDELRLVAVGTIKDAIREGLVRSK